MTQPFIGEIKAFGFGFPPRGYAACNGQLLPISQYQALFSLLGTTYGGNGVNNFGLPDLRSRTPMHSSPALAQGTPTGTETVTITSATMAGHSHLLSGTSNTGNGRAPEGNSLAVDNSANAKFYAPAQHLQAIDPRTIQSNGGGQPHENMQPFLVVNYCISLQGIFPSRN